MNVALKTLSAAMLLAGMAGNAMAAVGSPASADGLPANAVGFGTGDLIFAYEAPNLSSVIWDLSNGTNDLNFSDILTSSSFSISNSLVSSFVAANPNGRWNIFGLTNKDIDPLVAPGAPTSIKYDKAGFAVTIKGSPSLAGVNGALIEGRADVNAQWISNANFGGLNNADAITATETDPWAFGDTTHGPSLANQNATGLVGETLGFFTILIDSAGGTLNRGINTNCTDCALKRPAVFTNIGDFTFSANGALSFTTPVPLPPAVWLLGSAVVGLAGLRRRQA
jgi:hypothetical protein